MDKPFVTITYKTAGKRIRVEVPTSVKELLEQFDRQIRSQRRQDRRHLDYIVFIGDLTDTAMMNPQKDIANRLIRMESYKQLYTASNQLSEVQRRRLTLYFVGNLTHRQIAEIQGVNQAAIGHSTRRALDQLYNLLAE